MPEGRHILRAFCLAGVLVALMAAQPACRTRPEESASQPAAAPASQAQASARPAAGEADDLPFRPLTVGPYLLAPDTSSMTVCWATGQAMAGQVEFGPSPSYGRTVAATQPAERHKLTLTGLEPGREYHYRVVTPAGATQDFVFRALPGPGEPLRFVADGDQRGSRVYMRHLAAYRKLRPHLVMSLGDIADDNDADFDRLLRMDRGFWASTPWFPVFGNHDIVGDRQGRGVMRDVFAVPDPDVPGRADPCIIFYSFQAGGCRFIVVDEIEWRDESTPQERQAQEAWLARELADARGRTDTRFVFTFRHDSTGSLWEARQAAVPPMDIYFYGGIHNYFRGQLDNGLVVIQSSGGGVDRLRDVPVGDWIRAARMCFNYVLVDVLGDRLTLQAFDLGQVGQEPATVEGERIDLLEMVARPGGTTQPDPARNGRTGNSPDGLNLKSRLLAKVMAEWSPAR